MDKKKYYEAYDVRFRQVHDAHLQWFADTPTPIVEEVLNRFGIEKTSSVLEIGCGEGRDAAHLLKAGFPVLATDVSAEAVRYCREKYGYFEAFQVLDCLKDQLNKKFDCIYAVAVLHMLVIPEDRDGFWQFLGQHLKADGIALVCSMGNGNAEMKSDIRTAFQSADRVHEQTGTVLQLAGTSCCMVSFDTLRREIRKNGLAILEEGITCSPPDFPQMMYAVVKRA